MSLDGLRAWIGEVERKLGARTRVFLVLVAIAIGGAGAGIYLALEAENKGATTDEVAALEKRLDESGGAEGSVTSLQTQVNQLRSELEALRGEAKGGGAGGASAETPEIEAAPPGGGGGGGVSKAQREAEQALKKAEKTAKELAE